MKSRVSVKQMGLYVFAIILLITCWESNRTNIALADSVIPEQSIRLRILANSDTVADQAMKRRVRDAVIAQMNTWVKEPDGIVSARRIVQEQLPALRELVGSQLAAYGYEYKFQVELGKVPFPTKMYGNRVYPAGDYEALRITLGLGEGQNWWCVLFPPLCFVDAVSGEAVAKEPSTEGQTESKPNLQIKSKKQVHFYIWDKSKEAFSWLKHKVD
ncbi:MAG: spoIIR [Bacilli bacterium]|nr:spoIIR [Bacilli bacterium]